MKFDRYQGENSKTSKHTVSKSNLENKKLKENFY